MATTRTVTPNDDKIKSSLVAEKKLTGYINTIQTRLSQEADEVPEGAFQWLTTAEGEMQNQRAKLEKDGGR